MGDPKPLDEIIALLILWGSFSAWMNAFHWISGTAFPVMRPSQFNGRV